MPHPEAEEPPAPATARPPLAPPSRRAQAIALAALAAGAAYLAWRWGWTLDGASPWLALPLVLAETFGLVMLALLTFSCWRLARRPVPLPLPGRRVAVLVSTFDEDEAVLRPTVVGALGIRYDAPVEVWVLDDGGRPWVAAMCEELGARYLSRPAPRLHAKAGNLNNALTHVDAEFLVTLDADHVPRPELLERMLGHMADPAVAVVQAPQSFYNRGFGHPRRADDPLRNEQSIFFDVVCRGKDRHGAAFWCGCPSVLRRAALLDVGGVATDTVVEDAHTSMRLNQRGWRVAYHDEVMAHGVAPEEIRAFVVQRGRWARGSLQMLRLDPPFRARGLDLRQRIEYLASSLHFLEGPQRLVGLLTPAAVLATGALPLSAHPALYLAVFVPQLVLTPLASWALTGGRYRLLEGERYAIVRMEAYLRALSVLPRGRAGGFRVTPKGVRADRGSLWRALRLPLAICAATVAALGYQTTAHLLDLPGRLPPTASTATTLWALVNVALIVQAVLWARSVQHRRRSHRFPVSLHAAYSSGGRAIPSATGRLADISRHGARLWVPGRREVGEVLRLVVLLDDGPVEASGRIATVARGEGGGWMVGIDFDPLPPAAADAIVAWCLRHPFGLDHAVRPEGAPVEASPAPSAFEALLAAAETAAEAQDGREIGGAASVEDRS